MERPDRRSPALFSLEGRQKTTRHLVIVRGRPLAAHTPFNPLGSAPTRHRPFFVPASIGKPVPPHLNLPPGEREQGQLALDEGETPSLPGAGFRWSGVKGRQNWNEGILPSTRAGRPRSQMLRRQMGTCEQFREVVVDARHAENRLPLERLADIMDAVRAVLQELDNHQNEVFGLVQRVQDLVARQRNRCRAAFPPRDLDERYRGASACGLRELRSTKRFSNTPPAAQCQRGAASQRPSPLCGVDSFTGSLPPAG